jgi:hypothetical protein
MEHVRDNQVRLAQRLATAVLLLAFVLAAAVPASARRAAHGKTKAAILHAWGSAPSQITCINAWVSTVRPNGKNWAFAVDVGTRGVCANSQPGDAAYFNRVRGKWRVVVQDDEINCNNGAFRQVPLSIQADLLGCNRSHDRSRAAESAVETRSLVADAVTRR